ncbi:hypothetical protein CpB0151 [Chlamydia pneumoniae TW-183]|uniref:Uncharacterized protein n=2 Tax=Chlamydia pneumoniae TaxID=83558 RepID=A0A0F7XSK1_CHLPN|nr:hypothetical protein [Chlamydia pneumoniae]AAP98084.1 hypothetical protein CpB0151 [Chlamydia pneumoniae TW-183]CRI35508.1 Uncharacterized protein BN1224_CM1_A_01550 [Chlamydia pneumoniae]CRI41155.1 Uncharacterized protein BN1224_GiD_A_01560 [Chlamydia pneumoniae]CRI51300.1 Uncharacterized protein BN1224_UZG1_A_01550 [Chlamydia pneumoniae]CRI72792.1 Uncharacterized protein BN1224_YK41_AM_00010 [Chlamydia pneumoniae]
MASSSNNSTKQDGIPSWVNPNVQWNRASQVGDQEANSLTPEAQTSRSWFSDRKHFLEVLDVSLEEMENNDLKKYSRYKTIILIATLVTVAITCIVPISMVFGIPMWVPCLILFGAGLSSAFLSHRLQSKCKEIHLRYRAYQIYRQQLLSQYPDLRKSTLYKYSITHVKPKKGFVGKLVENLRPDLHKNKDDGGAAADSRLDFAGYGVKHYQTDALLGVSGVNSVEWQRLASLIMSVKNDILNDVGSREPIDKAQRSALVVSGKDIGGEIQPGGILDISRDILAICGYGMNVGVEAKKAIDQYKKWYLNSSTFIAWNPQLPAIAQSYLLEQQRHLDYAAKIFQDLSALTTAHGTGQALEDLDSLLCYYDQLIESKGVGEKIIASIHQKHLDLAMQDSCDQEHLKKWSNLYHVFSITIKEFTEGKLEQNEVVSRIQRLRGKLEKSKCSILGNCRTNAEYATKSEKKLADYLLQIGDREPFLTGMHKAIATGKAIQGKVEGVISQHPEKQIMMLRCSIERLEGMLRREDWGAILQKNEDEVLALKSTMEAQLQGFKDLVGTWEGKYQEFKKNKLSKVLVYDFTKSYSNLLNRLEVLHAESSTDDLVLHVDRMSEDLKKTIEEIDGNLFQVTPEELSLLAREYQGLMNELPLIVQEGNRLQEAISSEGVSQGLMLLNSLLNRDEKINKNIESSRKNLVAIAKQARSDARNIDSQGLAPLIQRNRASLDNILQNMYLFNGSIRNIHALDTETLVATSSNMFSAMHTFDWNIYTNLLDVLEIQSKPAPAPMENPDLPGALPEEVQDAVAEDVSGTHRLHHQVLKRRCADLKNMISQLQKSINKWGMAKAIVLGIVAVLFCVLSAIFIGQNILSLLILSCVGLLLTQVCPLIFDRISKSKEFEKQVLETAQSLIPATKILPSEFNNKDLNRLAKLQDNLNLEGFGPTWARNIVSDLEGIPTKEKSLKDLTKEFRKDSKNLNKRIKRRFKEGLGQEAPVVRPTIPQDIRGAEVFAELHRELEHLQKQKEEISIRGDALVQERMGLCLEKSKYDNEKAHAAAMTKKVGKLQNIDRLQKNNETYVRIQNFFRTLIQEKLGRDTVQEIDVVKEAKELHELAAIIYGNTSGKSQKQRAKKQFKENVLHIAGKGQLELLEAYLNVTASQGLCRHQMQASFRERILLNPDGAKHGEAERTLASREEMLKTLGLSYLTPFVRFSSPESTQSGYNQILKVREQLFDIEQRLQNQETVSPEDYAAVQAALAAYVRKHESLIVSTYGLGAQEGQTSSKVTTLMRDLHAVEELVEMGVETYRLNRSDQILHRVHSVLHSHLRDSDSSGNGIIDVVKKLFELLNNNGNNPNDPECQKYMQILLDAPVSLLYGAFKSFKNEFLLNFTELNIANSTKAAEEEAKRYVEEKGRGFETYWEEAKQRLEAIAAELDDLRNQETLLEQEIRLANLKISIFSDLNLREKVSVEKAALEEEIQGIQEQYAEMQGIEDLELKQKFEDLQKKLEALEERLLQIGRRIDSSVDKQKELLGLLGREEAA